MRSRRFVVVLVAAMLAAGALPAPAAAGNATGRNVQMPAGLSVSGLVSDGNGDPVLAAGVQLCLAIDECWPHSTQTASDGTFAFHGVAAGTWYLVVTPPEGRNLLAAYDTGAPGGSGDVADAQPFSLVADRTGVAITLPAGLRLQGHVLDPEGQPVAGVEVVGSSGSPVASDATGAYEVVGLSAGTVSLHVYPPADSVFLTGYYNGSTVTADYDDQAPIVVTGSGDPAVDITLVRGRTISGQLTGTEGAAVTALAEGDYSREATLDADGHFTLGRLWPGIYSLDFLPTPVDDTDGGWPYGRYNGTGEVLVSPSSKGVSIDVRAADVTGITAPMRVLPSIRGSVRDWTGPIAGAGLTICGSKAGCVFTRTDANGRYVVLNVPAGTYTVQGGAAHHVAVGYASGRSVPNPDSAVGFKVGTAGVTGLNLVMPMGNTVSGHVTGPGGTPIAGITVDAIPATGGIPPWGPGGAETRNDGAYAVTGLVDGTYKLSFSGPENSPYLPGYWSGTGYTASWASAAKVKVSDTADPKVAGPRPGFTVGKQLGASTVPVRIGWTGYDPGSGIHHFTLGQQRNGGSWATAASPIGNAKTRTLTVGATYRFRVKGTDFRSNVSSYAYGPAFKVVRTQQASASVHWAGTWTTTRSSSASGGSYRSSTAAGARATYTFTGRAIAWVATKGTGFGQAQVSIDGGAPVTVDLHASATSWRRIVFAASWSSSAKHTIRITNLATAGHPKVDVDAFVVLR